MVTKASKRADHQECNERNAFHSCITYYRRVLSASCRDGPPTVATIEVLTCLPNERAAIMHGREKRHRGVKPNVWEWFPGKGSMGPVHLSVIAGLVNGGQPSNARLLACLGVCARVNLFEGPRAILPRSASVALRTLPSKITSCPRLTCCLRDFFVVSDPTRWTHLRLNDRSIEFFPTRHMSREIWSV